MVWHVDDGQVSVRLHLSDTWLRALDAAVASFGAIRGSRSDNNIKSTCRLLCPPPRRSEFDGWDTDYVRSTTDVLGSDDPTVALGAPLGPRVCRAHRT